MNPSDFEKQLQRQQLRQIPAGWREEILGAAQSAATRPAHADHSPVRARTFPELLAAFLWPSPKAWSALAVLWILIAGFHFAASDHQPQAAAPARRESPEVLIALEHQRRLLVELLHPPEPPKNPIDRPQRRSERQPTVARV